MDPVTGVVILAGYGLFKLGEFLWNMHTESVAEDRMKADKRQIEGDANQTKYTNDIMHLRQFNAALEVQKRGILLDKVETLEANRKKKYKNHGNPVGHA